MPKPRKISLSAAADTYLGAFAARRKADAEVKRLKEHEVSAKNVFVALMLEADQTAIENDAGRVSVKPVSVPKIDNRTKFYDWCARTKNMECLQPRVSDVQLREVMAANPRLKPGGIVFESVLKVTPTLRKK